MKKTCIICKKTLDKSNFYKDCRSSLGIGYRCKPCDSYHRKTSITRYISHTYDSMKQRIKSRLIYKNKSLLTRQEFILFSRANKDFLRLFKEWHLNGTPRKLAPSINRIDSSKGYQLDNLEWITQSQNSSLSSVTKRFNNIERNMIYSLLGVKIEK